MIADLYPPRQRAAAMSFYGMGASLGIMAGFLFGSWLNHAVGWRMAFVLLGGPGILLAGIFRLAVPEPQRASIGVEGQSFLAGIKYLAGFSTLRFMAAGVLMSAIAMYGPIIWGASFLIRVHYLNVVQVGTWLALVLGAGGGISQFGVGMLGDRLGRGDKRWYFWLPAAILAVSVPLLASSFLADDARTALIFLTVPLLLSTTYAGVSLSILSSFTPPRFRATATAIYLAIASGGGLGLGSGLIGFLSDRLAPSFGSASLARALLLVVPSSAAVGALLFLLASRSLRRELPETEEPVRASNLTGQLAHTTGRIHR